MKLTTKHWNWIAMGMCVICFILIFICFYQLRMEEDTCISDPLIYGAKKVTEANNAEFFCTCRLISNKVDFISPIITFDQYGIDVKHVKGESKYYESNISIIESMFKK